MIGNKLVPSLRSDFRFDVQPEVVPWLEENITIPPQMSPASPGPFSTRSRPIGRPILECWHPNSGVRSVTFAAGSQLMKSTVLALGVCYRTKFSPMPTMIVGPSEGWVQRELSENRIGSLIEENEVLRMEMPFHADQFKKLSMAMAGGKIIFVGANSPTALAGSTQGIVAIDEASKIEHIQREDAPEAHPIKNAFERTKDFAGIDFHWMSSTPNSPTHLFWETFEKGDQTHFYLPCPHCGEFFALEFEQDKSKKLGSPSELSEEPNPDHYRSIVWSPDARNKDGLYDYEKILASSRYICPHNGCEIDDKQKPGMLEQYEQKVHNEAAPKTDRSFRAPSLYSPKLRFGDIAWKFLDRGDLFNTGLQTLYNSWLALPWEEMERNIKDDHVWACRAEGDMAYMKGQIPVESGTVAIFADPGQAQTHWVAEVIDREENVWVIDWGTVLGINDLLDLRKNITWPFRNNLKMKRGPQMGLCDSGDWTTDVYDMCARSEGFWWPSKGSDVSFGHWNKVQVKAYPSLMLYTFSDHVIKNDLYDRRIFQKKGSRLMLPSDAGPELVAGLSGQQRLNVNGNSRWKKIAWDHYGDCVKQGVLVNWARRAKALEE